MSDGEMTLNDLMNGAEQSHQAALEAEKKGVVINWPQMAERWRQVAYQTYNAGTNHIVKLEEELEAAKSALEDVDNTEPTGDAESTLTGRTHIT
jgi:predicted secreted acid phosphatase